MFRDSANEPLATARRLDLDLSTVVRPVASIDEAAGDQAVAKSRRGRPRAAKLLRELAHAERTASTKHHKHSILRQRDFVVSGGQ